jgi:hypothetical protein
VVVIGISAVELSGSAASLIVVAAVIAVSLLCGR